MRKLLSIFIACLAWASVFTAYSQSYLPLAGGTTTGLVSGPSFIQTGVVTDLAPTGTLITNGTSYNGGAINRSFNSLTNLNVGQYLTVDLSTPIPVALLSFGTWYGADGRFIPAGFQIDYSNDNATWTNYITVTGNTNLLPSYAPHVTAQYWRLTITAAQSGLSYVSISGLKLIADGWGSAGGGNYWNTPQGQYNIFTNSPVTIGAIDQLPSGYMLGVNGGILATEVLVQLYDDWPDYVFKSDYNLMPLSEVKSYIDQNHHLPDMPAAAEVEKNGQNLGEINKLLTKKVEELTLYLINQQKINESLQQQIDLMKTVLEKKKPVTHK